MVVVPNGGPPPVGLSSDEEELKRAGLADVNFDELHRLTGTDHELYAGDPTIGADD